MPEYIEREALLKDIEEERPENWTDSEAERQAENDFYKYREIVEIQPTADVVEVKHGRWIKASAYNDGIFNTAKCSVCETFQPIGEWDWQAYCPNCGAKMDLKEGAEE